MCIQGKHSHHLHAHNIHGYSLVKLAIRQSSSTDTANGHDFQQYAVSS